MKYEKHQGTPRAGIVTIKLRIPQCRSLKEKRSRLGRLTRKLRDELNVSVAEVGEQDRPSSSVICCAAVSSDWVQVQRCLNQVHVICEQHRGITITDSQEERLM